MLGADTPRHWRRSPPGASRSSPGLRSGQGAEALSPAGGLAPRTAALVKVATLSALDAPPASYASQIADAIEAGAGAEDLLGVLLAVGPLVGAPKAVAAAPEIMLALGLSLPESFG